MQFVNKVPHVLGTCFWYVLSEVVKIFQIMLSSWATHQILKML